MSIDAVAYAKYFLACQVHANFIYQPPEYLHTFVISWQLETYRMDTIGLITLLLSKRHRLTHNNQLLHMYLDESYMTMRLCSPVRALHDFVTSSWQRMQLNCSSTMWSTVSTYLNESYMTTDLTLPVRASHDSTTSLESTMSLQLSKIQQLMVWPKLSTSFCQFLQKFVSLRWHDCDEKLQECLWS